MQKHKVTHLVRVCDASYDVSRVAKEGIEVKDWPFVDGDAPPDAIITQWLDLVTRMSEGKGVRPCSCSSLLHLACPPSVPTLSPNAQVTGIHIHCVAGLGRAPVLVGIALVEVKFCHSCPFSPFPFPHSFARTHFAHPLFSERNGRSKCHHDHP